MNENINISTELWVEILQDREISRSYLKNGKLAHKVKIGVRQWTLQKNSGQ